MPDGRAAHRCWAGYLTLFPLLFALQTTTPDPGVGVGGVADYWPTIVRAGWFLGGFLVVVLVGRFLVEPILARIVRDRNRNNPTLRDAIFLYFRAFFLVAAVLVGVGFAGYGQVLTSSALIVGAATLAIGVAGQQVLGSFVSGTALVFDPDFNVGNYIEWDGGEGIVESISLRVTRVKTPDGELVTIPNTVLTSQAVTRPYGRGKHRIVERISLTNVDDIDEVTRLLEGAAVGLDGVLANPAPSVYVDELTEDGVVLRVRYWIEDPYQRNVFAIRSAYVRTVRTRLAEAGIAIESVLRS
ncbi:mechanosensitive ion channel family protein [Halobium salinum]|uniref:Mechanosensitive ion channel family protein n=1 Tax=Halobium salinum TaxID=1364940 RepID=A0ABD5PD68_9EURY|nr:mechanosensitive ion channel family protein [Halobium salinum]